MLVSLKHKLVLLAQPKCGSTALEAALGPHVEVVISGHPQAKHTPFRKYDRFLRRYFETFTDGPLEVVCLFREPVDWLGSWWRYRARDKIAGTAQSTQGLSFEAFVTAYLDEKGAGAKLGRQAQFVSDKEGAVGVDRIWRYDNMADCAAWLGERLGVPVDLDRLNVSPPRTDAMGLSDPVQARLMEGLARDFEIYRDRAV